MNTKKTLLLSALLFPAVLAFRLPAAKVRFAPAEGTSTVKTFVHESEFALDNMSVKINGQEGPAMPEMDMTMTSNQRIVVTDEYVANRDGAPKKLRRRFDELGNDMSMVMKMEMMGQSNDQSNTVKATSELTGKTVVFTWDEEAKDYRKAFDPEEGDSDLLEDLTEDMDLRVLLPKGEVAEGEEWEIDVKELGSVLAPGGNLALVPEEAGEAMGMGGNMSGMGSLSDWLGELLEGNAKGTFAGTRKVADKEVAVIKVTAKVHGSKDMTDMVSEAMEKAELPPGANDMKIDHMDIEFKMDSEGELLWDLAAGRMHSFEMSGPMTANIDMAMKMSVQGQNLSIEQAMEMSGTSTMTAKAN
jgi:hypothetical protein